MATSARLRRIELHQRHARWRSVPLRIEMSECINCDNCLRYCPPEFGAIFNHGIDVIILPELCSGCGKCLPPVCPVNCIYEDPDWTASPDDWWEEPLGPNDPYG
jgi:electron transport complex protein RnfB